MTINGSRLDYNALISSTDLARIRSGDVVVFDCRFALLDPEEGRRAYRAGHIPGAWYADLDRDLSSPVVPGVTGRHPLPDPEAFAAFLSKRGVGDETQVVCYDDRGGAYAGRLWWLCKWIGHERAAVLDGGIDAWIADGGVISVDAPVAPGGGSPLRVELNEAIVASADEIQSGVYRTVVDARATARYAGEEEPIDPVAGHIPGAVSLPYEGNLSDGRFRSADDLRDRFGLLEGVESGEVVCYCGSGVTAAHDALAVVAAGYPMPRVYPGSWSEWITDRTRPIETGRTD